MRLPCPVRAGKMGKECRPSGPRDHLLQPAPSAKADRRARVGGAAGPSPGTIPQRAVPTSGVDQAMAKDTQFSNNPQPDQPKPGEGAQHPPAPEGAAQSAPTPP